VTVVEGERAAGRSVWVRAVDCNSRGVMLGIRSWVWGSETGSDRVLFGEGIGAGS
jgi:hypothetical protein